MKIPLPTIEGHRRPAATELTDVPSASIAPGVLGEHGRLQSRMFHCRRLEVSRDLSR